MAELSQDRELKNALSQIEKQFGKGAIMQLGERDLADVPGISTGALSLDIALGGRGLPRGRIVEIFGPESSGKTTVALHAVANAQRQGGVAAFIDAEHALDPAWAKRIGVDLESLLVSQPSNAEEALKIAEMLVKSNAVDITSGGLALKFYSSVRLDIRKVGSIKEGEEVTGNEVKVKVVKNKVAPPFRSAEFDLMYEGGISREGDLINLGLDDKLIEKSGAWLNYGDIRLGQGKENAKQYLRDNPTLIEEITQKILEKRGLVGNLAAGTGENGVAQEPAKPEPPAKRESSRKQSVVVD
jgi:RecA/RadA recombinase